MVSKARGNKKGSLNYQINQRMKQMERFGESRYEAKKDYNFNINSNAQGKTTGIHSYNTFGTYKSTCKQFTKWAKENNKGFKNIQDVKAEHIKEYIQDRAKQGYSAYTYSKDLAGLNKVFGTNVTKKDCGVANRSYKNISNNRTMKEHYNNINYNNYKSEITVLKATGIRRESLTKVSASSFNYDKNGYPTAIRLKDERAYGGANMKEKNGRARVAKIPKNMRGQMKGIIENKLRENGGNTTKPFYNKVPNKLGTHRFRQEYAKNMYNEYIKDNGYGSMSLQGTGKAEFKGNTNTVYRGHDVGALKYTTENLGHNRLDVVVYNYLSA